MQKSINIQACFAETILQLRKCTLILNNRSLCFRDNLLLEFAEHIFQWNLVCTIGKLVRPKHGKIGISLKCLRDKFYLKSSPKFGDFLVIFKNLPYMSKWPILRQHLVTLDASYLIHNHTFCSKFKARSDGLHNMHKTRLIFTQCKKCIQIEKIL